MTGRGDDLAARFSSRLKATPTKGRVASEPVVAAEPMERAREPVPVPRPRRGASGTVLRGHLVPAELHAALSRRKVELQIARGVRVTWSDVVAEALVGATADRLRPLVHATPEAEGTGPRRLLQATLAAHDERHFLRLHLELTDPPDRSPSIESVWTAVLAAWLQQPVAGIVSDDP